MYTDEKIYSIELGEDLAPVRPSGKPRAAAEEKPDRSRTRRPAAGFPSRRESKPPRQALHFAPLVILTYLLGPFSVHLNPENRERRKLLTAGMISGMAGAGLIAGRGFIPDVIGNRWPLWPWLVLAAVVLATAFTVWARTAYLAVRGRTVVRHKLPAALRRPWVVGILGLIAPGLGLLLAGCARRGAAVIWAGWTQVAAAVVLAGGLPLWERNQAAGAGSIQPEVLEVVFMAAAAVLTAGLVVWVAQALEGARQMMSEPVGRPSVRGDWYAAALLGILVTAAVVWDPAVLARNLDNGGTVLREKGFRIIPLQMARGAHRLDPAALEHAVMAIELYGELGRSRQAADLRRELDENLQPYLAMVRTENSTWAGPWVRRGER